jgi:hypothetical protein
MKLTKRKLRKILLKEMDLMGMGIDMGQVMQAVQGLLAAGLSLGAVMVALLSMLGPVMFNGFIDGYYRGLFSENEFKRFVDLQKTDPEAAKRYADRIITTKGYSAPSESEYGQPVHLATGEVDARHARDYTAQHGDIDFDPYDDDLDY